MSYQNGKISDWFFSGLVVLLILWFSYAYTPASSVDVQAVVGISRQSVEATAQVKTFLEKNPSPSNVELADLNSKVNELVVRDTARKVTGNPSLKSATEQRAEDAKARHDHEASEEARLDLLTFSTMSQDDKVASLALWFSRHWMVISFAVIFVGVLLWGGAKALREYR